MAAGLAGRSFLPGRYGGGGQALLCARGGEFCCPGFNAGMNGCEVYAARPLDCRLYPFVLMYEAGGGGVWLGVDGCCPVVGRRREGAGFEACVGELAGLLEGPLLGEVVAARGMVMDWFEKVAPARRLPGLSEALCGRGLGLSRLAASARPGLGGFFAAHGSGLLGHTFASVGVWGDVFSLFWKVCGERLLLFAEGEGDCFLMAPPLGRGDVRGPAAEGLEVMCRLNRSGVSPRIQEADEGVCEELAGRGWRVRERAVEYVYARRELAELRGGGYAKQRQMCNRFEREHEWVWRPYVAKDFPAAVRLYGEWLAQRRRVYPEPFFAAQGEAFFRAVVRGLRDADALGLTVRVLEADGEMAGITGGLGLHDGRSFGVLFEVTDLSVKGAAQFIFREFCRETAGFDYVNVGGASGLANLARVKESYLPFDRPGSAVLAPTRTREGV